LANLACLPFTLFRSAREDAAAAQNGGQRGRPNNRRQVAGTVRCYLAHYVQLCSESPDHYRHQPNLRMLDAISRTLEAVYRRMGINMQQVSQLTSRREGAIDDREAMPATSSSVPTSAIQTLPYNTRTLHWNSSWTRNKEEKYCYCGENKPSPALQCTLCKNWFHHDCTTDVVPKDGQGFLPFQVNYRFACAICSSTDRERFELTTCSWIDSVMGAMGNLMWETQRDMFKVVEVGDHLEEHWDILCFRREKKPNWRGPLNSYFTNNKDRFRQEKPFWGLADPNPDGHGPILQPCRVLRGAARPPPQNYAKSSAGAEAWRPPAGDRRTKSGRLVKAKNQDYAGHAPAETEGDNSMQMYMPQRSLAPAPLGHMREQVPVPVPVQADICGVCNCEERTLGNPSRNKLVCLKCDEDMQADAKIPIGKPVWEAQVLKEDDPIPYALYLCTTCNIEVNAVGHYDWQRGKQRIAATEFKPSEHAAPTEAWVECEFCETWYHQVCVRWEEQIHGADWPVLCPSPACQAKAQEKFGREKMETASLQISAADLPQSQLSQHLERTLASEVFGGTQAHGVTIRVTSNVRRTVSVTDKIGKRYKRDEAAQELPYRQKNIFAFYTCPDGSQIAFFSLMAQEYGADCPAPNKNTAYISYLDSNQLYHCAGCNAHDDKLGPDWYTKHSDPRHKICSTPEACKSERRKIYHALFIGYLDYLKQRGLERSYIWVMPPETRDQDYVFFCRPKEMHIPTAKELEMWYIRVLEEAKVKGVISSFEDNTGRRLSPSASRTAQKDARKPGFLFRSSSASTPKPKNSEAGEETEASRPAKRARGAGVSVDTAGDGTNSAGGDEDEDHNDDTRETASAGANNVENAAGHSGMAPAGFLDMDMGLEMDTMGMGSGMMTERQPLSPLSPRSQATSSSDRGAQTPPRSLRHMPIFNGDFLAEVIDEVLATVQQDESDSAESDQQVKAEPSAEASSADGSHGGDDGGDSAGASSAESPPRPKLKRTHSDRLVDEVEKRMSHRKMGSYIVCYFDAAEGERDGDSSEPMRIADDPELSIDNKPPQTTLDRRENLVRLCADRHYQFNTMRHGKFSTMMLLHYWMNKVELKHVTKQMISQQSTEAGRHASAEEAMSAQTDSSAAAAAAAAATGGMGTSMSASFDAEANQQQTDMWQQKLQERQRRGGPQQQQSLPAVGVADASGMLSGSSDGAGGPPAPPPPSAAPYLGQPPLPSRPYAQQTMAPQPQQPQQPQQLQQQQQQRRPFPACTTKDFDRLIVDQLQQTLLSLGGNQQLDVVRRFVVSQRQQEVAPHLRVSRLVTKLVKLLGIEVMCQATTQVVGAQVGQIERMTLGGMRDQLTAEQRQRLQEIAQRGGGLGQAVQQAATCVGLQAISQGLCDVIDYTLTAQNRG
jgi:hypothetical protein